jgi:hypothetical protein
MPIVRRAPLNTSLFPEETPESRELVAVAAFAFSSYQWLPALDGWNSREATAEFDELPSP